VFCRRPQRLHGTLHRQHGRLQYVNPIDLPDIGMTDSPSKRLFLYFLVQGFTPCSTQTLGVLQPGNRVFRIKDDRAGNYRPGQRAAPGLINTRDQALGTSVNSCVCALFSINLRTSLPSASVEISSCINSFTNGWSASKLGSE